MSEVSEYQNFVGLCKTCVNNIFSSQDFFSIYKIISYLTHVIHSLVPFSEVHSNDYEKIECIVDSFMFNSKKVRIDFFTSVFEMKKQACVEDLIIIQNQCLSKGLINRRGTKKEISEPLFNYKNKIKLKHKSSNSASISKFKLDIINKIRTFPETLLLEIDDFPLHDIKDIVVSSLEDLKNTENFLKFIENDNIHSQDKEIMNILKEFLKDPNVFLNSSKTFETHLKALPAIDLMCYGMLQERIILEIKNFYPYFLVWERVDIDLDTEIDDEDYLNLDLNGFFEEDDE